MAKRKNVPKSERTTDTYAHPEAKALLRPDVGTQAQFKKRKEPTRYRYDSSLSPALDFDGGNFARELGEWLIARIEEAARLPAPHKFEKARELTDPRGVRVVVHGLEDAVQQLKRLSKPFLDWAGKAERLSFDVPTLPLFVHERLSTKAILETLKGHKRDKSTQHSMYELFGDPELPVHEQVLRAYEHQGGWQNRMVLGDSLVVMNSLLRYEGLGGQVQMIYMDPPYGVEFGSNFQPFVRQRDVKDGDEDMTREPEMVKAYRDTWELGLHSYLTYMRDRLLLARDMLTPSGSIFVQISDKNLHHVREVMDEVFGAENFIVTIFLRKKGSQRGNEIKPINDHLIWFAKDRDRVRRRFLYDSKLDATDLSDEFEQVELPDGSVRATSGIDTDELEQLLQDGAKLFTPEPLTSGGEYRTQLYPVVLDGRTFTPPPGNCWKFNEAGMQRIMRAGRIHVGKNQIRFKKYHTDFPFRSLTNMWSDLAGAADKVYVVQTAAKAIRRCILMTTDPGDLVFDPTCGSGTTAYVAEQWGRRWITVDTSRVPLALARQRLLTATYFYFALKDPKRGPAGGFDYQPRIGSRGDQSGGIVSHITSTSIANNESAEQEVLVDRPEVDKSTTRVTGLFCFEATIPTPIDFVDDGVDDSGEDQESYGSFLNRMLEVLRRNPLLQLSGGKSVKLQNIRSPAKTLSLSAEASIVNGSEKLVAIVFGPENGAVSQALVYQALQEAHLKGYAHLYVIGFAIQPNARGLIENAEAAVDVPATYVQATPDIIMGDLLKTMRSSQIFSVCGLPDVKLHKLGPQSKGEPVRFAAELRGLDVFDPSDMSLDQRKGDDVPAWFLDADYNGLCFHVTQAFFPRTAAWDDLKRALKGQYDDSVWDHLAGTTSAPFEAGEHGQVAVKVIDDRGNELMVVRSLREAQS